MSNANRDIRLTGVTLHLTRYICVFFEGQPDERLKELPSCPPRVAYARHPDV